MRVVDLLRKSELYERKYSGDVVLLSHKKVDHPRQFKSRLVLSRDIVLSYTMSPTFAVIYSV